MPSQRLENDRVCVQYQESLNSPGVCSLFRFSWNAQNLIRSSTFGTQMVGIYVSPQWQHFRFHEKFLYQRWIGEEQSKSPELAAKTLALEEECLTLPKEAYKNHGHPERTSQLQSSGQRRPPTDN